MIREESGKVYSTSPVGAKRLKSEKEVSTNYFMSGGRQPDDMDLLEKIRDERKK